MSHSSDGPTPPDVERYIDLVIEWFENHEYDDYHPMMQPILRSAAVYTLYKWAARDPRWVGRPFAMVNEYGPEHVAVTLRDYVAEYPPLQEVLGAVECMCANCEAGVMSVVAWAQEDLMEDLRTTEQATIARSQRR